MDNFLKRIGLLIEMLSPFCVGYIVMSNNGLTGHILGVMIMIIYAIYLFVYKFKD